MNVEFLALVPRIKIVDVGAMASGNTPEVYARLASTLQCDVIGFEPVEAECAKLNAAGKPGHTYLPYWIGDGSKRTFYECRATATSSVFEPNSELLDKFQNLGNLVTPIRLSAVETKRLDDIPEVEDADFVKLDIQGAELLALEGAHRILGNVAALQVEVEFVPLYKEQPLFADVDTFLRRRGFAFHRFAHTRGRAFKPITVNNNINAPLSQTLWGDAIYVKDFMAFDRLPAASLLKLAAILHLNYSSVDLAALALASYDKQQGTALHPTYLHQLTTRADKPAA